MENYAKGNANQVRILTDHKNLIPFTTTKELNGRQIRWSEKLSQFNLSIEYRPGKQGGKPDTLTRRTADLPTPEDNRKTQRQRVLLPKERYFKDEINTMITIKIEDREWQQRLQEYTTKEKKLQEIRKELEKKRRK